MEVHHHSHGHAHVKKTWKNYFWEFLMLFLAVFCGYLAEYKLEHSIEKERGKKYMEGFVSDLKSDLYMMNTTIAFAQQLSTGLDSLQKNLYSYNNTSAKTLELYSQNFKYLRWILPDFHDKTAIQLRNSGQMRLIENKEIAELITDYWIGINDITKNTDAFIDKCTKAEELATTIFSREYLKKNVIDFSTNSFNTVIDSSAKMMSNNDYLLISYANRIGRMTDISKHYLIPLLKQQQNRAEKLMKSIHEEYGIQ